MTVFTASGHSIDRKFTIRVVPANLMPIDALFRQKFLDTHSPCVNNVDSTVFTYSNIVP